MNNFSRIHCSVVPKVHTRWQLRIDFHHDIPLGVILKMPGPPSMSIGFSPLLEAEALRQEALVSTTCMMGTEHPKGLFGLTKWLFKCPASQSALYLARGTDGAQAGPQVLACMERGQGLSCLRPNCPLLPTGMGGRIQPVPGGPRQPSGRLHLGDGRPLHRVLYKSTVYPISDSCVTLGTSCPFCWCLVRRGKCGEGMQNGMGQWWLGDQSASLLWFRGLGPLPQLCDSCLPGVEAARP